MIHELKSRTTERGTKMILGYEAEKSITRLIKDTYDLSPYKFSLHLVKPNKPTAKDLASEISIKRKAAILKDLGLSVEAFAYSEDDLIQLISNIRQANNDLSTIGIIIQLPVPPKFTDIKDLIAFEKDIDGIRQNNPVWKTCATSEAALRVLTAHGSKIGEKVAVIGSRGFVGQHLMRGAEQRGVANVVGIDIGDSPDEITKCDSIVSAVGRPGIVGMEKINPHGIYLGVDIGQTLVNGKARGDFNINEVDGSIDYLTPVPNGMGPLGLIVLAERVVQSTVDSNFTLVFSIK